MKQYTIYCTDKQVKKALELGAPLDGVCKQDGTRPIYYTLPTSDPKWMDCDAYYMPTAEQMIGWLETRGEFRIEISTGIRDVWFYYIHISYGTNYKNLFYGGFHTRKEATLAAIDAALDYLVNNI